MAPRSHFIKRIIISFALICLASQCRMADLNNPNDALSDEFAKRSVLSEFVRYLLREKALPDALVLLVHKGTVPYEAGIRVYRVDPDSGLTGEYVSDVRAAVTTAFPGCQPLRVSIPPSSRDIITFTGSGSDRVAVHRFGIDHSLTFVQDQNGFGAPGLATFSADGTTMYSTNSSSNPNSVNRSSRDIISGSITLNNVGSYPFAVGCSPSSIQSSKTDGIIFTATTLGTPAGVYVHKKVGADSVSLVGGTPFDPADNPSSHNNLCLSETDRLLYMTSTNTSYPIYGFRYDVDGNMQVLPNSPFSPDPAYTAAAPTDNFSTSMAMEPNGKFAAFLYSAGGTFYIRLLAVDGITGNLIPTDQKLSVGNSPKHLDWDRSGKFIYLVSDTGGTTNKFQMEYFQFSSNGTLSRGVNSPITFSNMSGEFSAKDLKSISRYYQ